MSGRRSLTRNPSTQWQRLVEDNLSSLGGFPQRLDTIPHHDSMASPKRVRKEAVKDSPSETDKLQGSGESPGQLLGNRPSPNTTTSSVNNTAFIHSCECEGDSMEEKSAVYHTRAHLNNNRYGSPEISYKENGLAERNNEKEEKGSEQLLDYKTAMNENDYRSISILKEQMEESGEQKRVQKTSSEEISDSAKGESSEQTSDDTKGESSEQISDDAKGESSEQISDDAKGESSEQISDSAKGESSEQISDSAKGESSEQISDSAKGESSEQTSDDAKGESSEQISDDAKGESSEQISDDAKGESSEQISDDAKGDSTEQYLYNVIVTGKTDYKSSLNEPLGRCDNANKSECDNNNKNEEGRGKRSEKFRNKFNVVNQIEYEPPSSKTLDERGKTNILLSNQRQYHGLIGGDYLDRKMNGQRDLQSSWQNSFGIRSKQTVNHGLDFPKTENQRSNSRTTIEANKYYKDHSYPSSEYKNTSLTGDCVTSISTSTDNKSINSESFTGIEQAEHVPVNVEKENKTLTNETCLDRRVKPSKSAEISKVRIRHLKRFHGTHPMPVENVSRDFVLNPRANPVFKLNDSRCVVIKNQLTPLHVKDRHQGGDLGDSIQHSCRLQKPTSLKEGNIIHSENCADHNFKTIMYDEELKRVIWSDMLESKTVDLSTPAITDFMRKSCDFGAGGDLTLLQTQILTNVGSFDESDAFPRTGNIDRCEIQQNVTIAQLCEYQRQRDDTVKRMCEAERRNTDCFKESQYILSDYNRRELNVKRTLKRSAFSVSRLSSTMEGQRFGKRLLAIRDARYEDVDRPLGNLESDGGIINRNNTNLSIESSSLSMKKETNVQCIVNSNRISDNAGKITRTSLRHGQNRMFDDRSQDGHHPKQTKMSLSDTSLLTHPHTKKDILEITSFKFKHMNFRIKNDHQDYRRPTFVQHPADTVFVSFEDKHQHVSFDDGCQVKDEHSALASESHPQTKGGKCSYVQHNVEDDKVNIESKLHIDAYLSQVSLCTSQKTISQRLNIIQMDESYLYDVGKTLDKTINEKEIVFWPDDRISKEDIHPLQGNCAEREAFNTEMHDTTAAINLCETEYPSQSQIMEFDLDEVFNAKQEMEIKKQEEDRLTADDGIKAAISSVSSNVVQMYPREFESTHGAESQTYLSLTETSDIQGNKEVKAALLLDNDYGRYCPQIKIGRANLVSSAPSSSILFKSREVLNGIETEVLPQPPIRHQEAGHEMLLSSEVKQTYLHAMNSKDQSGDSTYFRSSVFPTILPKDTQLVTTSSECLSIDTHVQQEDTCLEFSIINEHQDYGRTVQPLANNKLVSFQNKRQFVSFDDNHEIKDKHITLTSDSHPQTKKVNTESTSHADIYMPQLSTLCTSQTTPSSRQNDITTDQSHLYSVAKSSHQNINKKDVFRSDNAIPHAEMNDTTATVYWCEDEYLYQPQKQHIREEVINAKQGDETKNQVNVRSITDDGTMAALASFSSNMDQKFLKNDIESTNNSYDSHACLSLEDISNIQAHTKLKKGVLQLDNGHERDCLQTSKSKSVASAPTSTSSMLLVSKDDKDEIETDILPRTSLEQKKAGYNKNSSFEDKRNKHHVMKSKDRARDSCTSVFPTFPSHGTCIQPGPAISKILIIDTAAKQEDTTCNSDKSTVKHINQFVFDNDFMVQESSRPLICPSTSVNITLPTVKDDKANETDRDFKISNVRKTMNEDNSIEMFTDRDNMKLKMNVTNTMHKQRDIKLDLSERNSTGVNDFVAPTGNDIYQFSLQAVQPKRDYNYCDFDTTVLADGAMEESPKINLCRGETESGDKTETDGHSPHDQGVKSSSNEDLNQSTLECLLEQLIQRGKITSACIISVDRQMIAYSKNATISDSDIKALCDGAMGRYDGLMKITLSEEVVYTCFQCDDYKTLIGRSLNSVLVSKRGSTSLAVGFSPPEGNGSCIKEMSEFATILKGRGL